MTGSGHELEQNPEDAWIFLHHVRVLVETGNHTRALELLDQLQATEIP